VVAVFATGFGFAVVCAELVTATDSRVRNRNSFIIDYLIVSQN
jgi:hypothetical protein